MGRPRVGEPELTRQIIIDSALKLLDRDGFPALSLANIAKDLNVKTPALYWYFPSKADLYTYAIDALFRDMLETVDPKLNGRDLLWALGCALHAQQRRVRDAAKLISTAMVSKEIRTELVPELLTCIAVGDITHAHARRTLTAIQALTLGWSIFEANPATSEVIRQSGDGDTAFEASLAELVYGEASLPAGSPRPVRNKTPA